MFLKINNEKKLLHKNQPPGIMLQNDRHVLQLGSNKIYLRDKGKKKLFELCPIFVGSVHNFGRSEGDII